MTRTPKKRQFAERLHEASLSVPCDFCGAPAGQPCKTKRGLHVQMVHVSRRRIGMDIMREQARETQKEGSNDAAA